LSKVAELDGVFLATRRFLYPVTEYFTSDGHVVKGKAPVCGGMLNAQWGVKSGHCLWVGDCLDCLDWLCCWLTCHRLWDEVARASLHVLLLTQLPKSDNAATYPFNQWEALNSYLEDRDLSIDNNVAKRAMKPVAIGRKNGLFVGSPRADRCAAILMTPFASCKAKYVELWPGPGMSWQTCCRVRPSNSCFPATGSKITRRTAGPSLIEESRSEPQNATCS